MPTESTLTNLPFASAFDLAVGESGIARDVIAHEMGWSTSQSYRFFSHEDNYWPNTASIPQLCLVLHNDILIEWLFANVDELRKGHYDRAPLLNEFEVLQLINSIAKEMGDVNEEVEKALSNDQRIDSPETRPIIKQAYHVLARIRELVAAMRTIQREN